MTEPKLRGVPETEIPKILVDEKCRKCFGRGWTARHEDNSVVPCVCTFKNLKVRHAKALTEAAKSMKASAEEAPPARGNNKTTVGDGQRVTHKEDTP